MLDSLALLNSQLRLERLLPTALDIILDLTSAERAFLLLMDQEGKLSITAARNKKKQNLRKADFRGSNTILRKVLNDKKALYLSDLDKNLEFGSESVVALNLKSAICIPLWSPQSKRSEGARFLGLLYVDSSSETRRLQQRQLRLVEALGNHVAISIENARLFEELEEKNKQTAAQFSAILVERSRISREIHDTLAQGLTGIILQLEAADALMTESSQEARQRVSHAQQSAKSTLLETKRSIWELRPAILENDNFETALLRTAEQILGDSKIQSEIHVNGSVNLPGMIENSLFRVVQEALWNVRKHSKANLVTIRLHCEPNAVRLFIEDDGVGFDGDSLPVTGHFGLIGIKERIQQLAGEFTIEARTREGTRLMIVLPLHTESDK